MRIQRVGVVGCGLMGSGIAQVSALAGFETVVREVSGELLEKGLQQIESALGSLEKKEKITPAARAEGEARLKGTTEAEDLAECDLIIEAVTENLEVKRELFETLDRVCRKSSILATNTSSLSVTELMTATTRREHFLGIHFFNPVPVMKLVEVVRTSETDPQVFDDALEFVRTLGKTPVSCEDRTGFLVNRLLIPYLLDAVRTLENGTGTLEDLDTAMKLGCGHPMGPFQLIDFIGLDTVFHIANILYEEFREPRMAPPPLLRRMYLEGKLGRKSGQGFYQYEGKK